MTTDIVSREQPMANQNDRLRNPNLVVLNLFKR